MNKYETLFESILSKTKSGEMVWKQIKRSSNSDIILHPNTVLRQFSSELTRDRNIFTTLLVEKKTEDPDFDFAFDKHLMELIVLDDGELIVTLTESVIERPDLLRLLTLVEGRNDKARALFGE